MLWLLLLLEFGGIYLLLYFLIKKSQRQSQIYSIIVESDSEIIPLQNIMGALQMDFSAVSKELVAMSTDANGLLSKYPLLKNSHVDIGKQCLVLSKATLEKQGKKTPKINKQQHVTEQTAIECETCGAINKENAANLCEYCGSPLK